MVGEELSPNYRIREGYVSATGPRYFPDLTSGVVWQPDVYRLAYFLGQKSGATHVLDLGCGLGKKLSRFAGRFSVTGVDAHGPNIAYCRDAYEFGEWIDIDLDADIPDLVLSKVSNKTMVICSDVIEHLEHPEHLLRFLRRAMQMAPLAIVSTPDRLQTHGEDHSGPPPNPCHVREWTLEEFTALLKDFDLPVAYSGLTASNNRYNQLATTICVVCNSQLSGEADRVTEEIARSGLHMSAARAGRGALNQFLKAVAGRTLFDIRNSW